MSSRINEFEREAPAIHPQEDGDTGDENLKPEVKAPDIHSQNTSDQIRDYQQNFIHGSRLAKIIQTSF
jgi:hypothetical protein